MKSLTAALLLCAFAVCQGSVNPGDFSYRKALDAGDSLSLEVGLFSLDGHPHLKFVQVDPPDLTRYAALTAVGA